MCVELKNRSLVTERKHTGEIATVTVFIRYIVLRDSGLSVFALKNLLV